MQIVAAIFDLDGVLVDTAQAHYRAWLRLAGEEGIYFDEQINERLKGVSRTAALDTLLEQSDQEFSPARKIVLAARKNNYYREIVSSISADDLLPGACAVLDTCRGCGIKTALASASKNAPMLIKKLGIASLLDYVVDAQLIKHSKPHPEIFLKAATGVKAEPQFCIAFEDAEAGIRAIRAAKMLAIGIGNHRRLHIADMVFESLADFSMDKVKSRCSAVPGS